MFFKKLFQKEEQSHTAASDLSQFNLVTIQSSFIKTCFREIIICQGINLSSL